MPSLSKDDGTRTPVNSSPHPHEAGSNRRPKTKFPKKFNPPKPPKKRPHSRHKSSYDYAHDAFYRDWDLVPPSPERAFPIWDSYTTVPEAFRQYSHRTLKELTRSSIVENSPTVPSPHELAVINNLQFGFVELVGHDREVGTRLASGHGCRTARPAP